MALSIKKTSARQLGQNSDRDVFAVYSGSKLYKHKTKSGMVFKFATTRSRAEEILKKLKSAGSSSAPKRAGASRPKARVPRSSSAKMTVASCSKYLKDQGYTVKKKKGKKKKTEDEEMSDQDIYLRDLMNPRRRRTRRKNPRTGMSYSDVLRILKEQAMVVRQTLPGKFRLKVEGSASPRASLTGRDYASIFGLDPASSFSVTMTPPGEESQTYHANMVGNLSPEAMSEMHPAERAQTARRYLMNSLPDDYRPRESRRKNPRAMRRLR